MECFLGIDLGTSSVRASAVAPDGLILAAGQREYDILKPEPLWAEQDMDHLWQATVQAICQMFSKAPELKGKILGVGFSGQMHGLVMVDKSLRPIRNAIIWADQRSARQIASIYSRIPEETFHSIFCNRLSAGFLLPSLMWVRENEPDNYQKIYKVMLPKDYIRLKMCGEPGTDASDASSTGMWNMKDRKWAYELIDRLNIPSSFLVNSGESCERAGAVTAECAELTGIPAGVCVSFGGGDSLMMELGNGMISNGRIASTIGTACNLTCALEKPVYDSKLRTNTWCHADSRLWSVMGAHLSGGVALKWLKNNILEMGGFNEMTACAGQAPAGSEGLLFLPYLNGERTPHNDPDAKAVYLGMTLRHTKAHIIRSAMEGIVYSMKESLSILKSMGIKADRVIASGGGARSSLFLQIQADMYNAPIYTNREKEQASLGAAMTGAVGCGYFKDYREACGSMVHLDGEVTEPNPEHVRIYDEGFRRFREIYTANKGLF